LIAATGAVVNRSAATYFTDRLGAIPAGGDLSDALEEPSLASADVGYFDHGAGVGLRVEIGEAAQLAADLPLVPHFVPKRQRAVVEALVIFSPVRHVLTPFPAGVQKLLVHRRRIVALLDQLDLEIAGIRQCNAHLDG